MSEEVPRLMAYGYDRESYNEELTWGYEVGLNADLGLSYEFPLYN